MKKFVINSIILLILVLVTLSLTDLYFKPNTQASYSKNVYKEEKGGVELAFFGSSHTFSTYNPKVFDSITGLSTFNFGSTAQRLTATKPVVEMVLNNEKLKLAIVDIFSMSLDTILSQNSKNLQYETLDNIDMSWSKIEAFKSIYGIENILNISPTIRNHSIWNNPDYRKKAFINKKYYCKGFHTSNRIFNSKTWNAFLSKQEKLNKKENNNNLKELTSREKNLIKQIVNQFKEADIPVIFCSAPSYNEQFNIKYSLYQDLIAKYLKSLGVPFLDYNNYWQELSLSKEDFKDPNHLNFKGAKKVSVHLSNIIKKEFLSSLSTDNLVFKEKDKSKIDEIVYEVKSEVYKLNNQVSISNYSVTKKKNGLEIKIIFDSLISKKELKKYRLGAHIYPEESSKNLISDRSKIKGSPFDIYNILLEETNGKEILLQINTRIKDFKKIKLFLYDKEKYRGIIGQPIWITNL